MLKVRQTVGIPVQEHRQVVVDVFLDEFVRKLLEIQCRLRNLQAVIVDRTVRVLSQAEFLSKQQYTVSEFGNNFNRFVQVIFGHGLLWRRGLMTGGLVVPSSSCTFIRT